MSAVQLLALAGGALVSGHVFGTISGRITTRLHRLSRRVDQLAGVHYLAGDRWGPP